MLTSETLLMAGQKRTFFRFKVSVYIGKSEYSIYKNAPL